MRDAEHPIDDVIAALVGGTHDVLVREHLARIRQDIAHGGDTHILTLLRIIHDERNERRREIAELREASARIRSHEGLRRDVERLQSTTAPGTVWDVLADLQRRVAALEGLNASTQQS